MGKTELEKFPSRFPRATRSKKAIDYAAQLEGEGLPRTEAWARARAAFHLPSELLFARGKWAANFADLGAAIEAFEQDFCTPLGAGGWEFVVVTFGEKRDPVWREWVIGPGGYDRSVVIAGTPENPGPNFEGWPCGTVRARRVPGGLLVEVMHGWAYQDVIRAYSAELVSALKRDGLVVVEEQPAGSLAASTQRSQGPLAPPSSTIGQEPKAPGDRFFMPSVGGVDRPRRQLTKLTNIEIDQIALVGPGGARLVLDSKVDSCCPVEIGEPHEPIKVFGHPKKVGPVARQVLGKMVGLFPKREPWDSIAPTTDVKVLKRLAKKDRDFKKAILLSGSEQGGYGLTPWVLKRS